MPQEGYPIVLTADRTLMAGYRLLFDGMLAASQTTHSLPGILGRLLMPVAGGSDGKAAVAPLGLRRIEAALLDNGFKPHEVAVAAEAELGRVIGPATRVVAVSTGEPAGMGMNSSTMTAITGGRIYPQAMFHRLMVKVRSRIAAAAPHAKVVLGGPGAWQVATGPAALKELGVDHVVTGYAETDAPKIFHALMRGESLPAIMPGGWKPSHPIPPIRGASTMGVVEISRGCGLGCTFCALARTPMVHLPPALILADARLNVEQGMTSICTLSEDFFRYGSEGLKVNPPAIIDLLERLRRLPGLRLIQLDHANVISVERYSDAQLRQIHQLLMGNLRHRYLWVNLGVETADGQLLRASGGWGKMGGPQARPWDQLSREQIQRLCEAGFFPMISLVVGLPGEKPIHVERTQAWVDSLQGMRVSIFPVLYAPMDGHGGPGAQDLRREHWRLIQSCYQYNYRWIPRMYWDNQAGAGVPLAKRLVMQGLGLGQMLGWKTLLAWHSKRSCG